MLKLHYSVLDFGLPSWLGGKESACHCRRCRDIGSIPGSGRYHGRGNGNPLQYPCLKNSTDKTAWGPTVYGVTESETTEQLSTHTCMCLISQHVNILKPSGTCFPRIKREAFRKWEILHKCFLLVQISQV